MFVRRWASATPEPASATSSVRDAIETRLLDTERSVIDVAAVAAADEIAAAEPIARVYGEPVLEIPKDLYIPPDALEVFLETFEGPLDLLLYLIRRQNIDVLDIPMAELTRQYLGYVELMRSTQLELAAEYLLMAAVLIEIKSRMLLPRPSSVDAEAGDPRAELVRQLLRYEQMKLAARRLDELPVAGRDFEVVQVWFDRSVAQRLPAVRADDLRAAWLVLLQRARVNRHHLVTREQLSVRAQMSRVLKRLESGEFVEFTGLFSEDADVAHLVVTLLAILELAKESLVTVTQARPYTPIYVRRSEERAEAMRMVEGGAAAA